MIDDVRKRIERCARLHPDVMVTEILGHLGLDLVEDGTSVGNLTVNYDIIRVR